MNNPFSTSSSTPATSSSDLKSRIIQQVQQESAMSNARLLINKVNENCFEKCIPTPGTSLSSRESSCLSSCMEKYIGAWNVTSRAYIARVQRHSTAAGSLGGGTF